MKKILPYLLLNIAVSAITMLGVILIWNAFHPRPEVKNGQGGLTTAPTEDAVSILPAAGEKSVEIQSVFLPGELNYEKIALKNVSDSPVDLTGWSLTNEGGDKFVFPTLTLYPDGAVEVYSGVGINTAVELYWNAPDAVWKSGTRALLLDSAGAERSQYLIP